MARVKIEHTWPDGDSLSVEVSVSESYPDVLDQARMTAHRLWAESLGSTIAALMSDEDDEAPE